MRRPYPEPLTVSALWKLGVPLMLFALMSISTRELVWRSGNLFFVLLLMNMWFGCGRNAYRYWRYRLPDAGEALFYQALAVAMGVVLYGFLHFYLPLFLTPGSLHE